MGLGRVGPERSRPRQAGRRLRLALDAQPHALQRPGRGRPGLRQIADRRPAPVPAGRPVQDPVGERLVARRRRRRKRDRRPRGGAVVAVRARRPHRSDARHEQRAARRTAHRDRLALRRLHRCLPTRPGERGRNTGAGPEHHLGSDPASEDRPPVRRPARLRPGDRRLSPLGLREARAARRGHTCGPVARTSASRRRDRGQRARPGLRHSGRPQLSRSRQAPARTRFAHSARPARSARSPWIRRARPSAPRS